MIDINRHPSVRQLRWFGGVLLPLFLVVIGGAAARRALLSGAYVIWALAAVSAVVGWLWPARMKPVFVGWMRAAYPIGWVVSQVVLIAAFFLVVTPSGLVMRMLGHDPLTRRFERGARTYWIEDRGERDRASYFRMF